MNKRIYVAGKLNGMACDYIKNVHDMIQQANAVRRMGFAVFVPGLDFLMGVQFGDWEYDDYFNNSQPWLEVSDALFITPGWETSSGTKKEIGLARQKGIPMFFELEELKEYARLKGWIK